MVWNSIQSIRYPILMRIDGAGIAAAKILNGQNRARIKCGDIWKRHRSPPRCAEAGCTLPRGRSCTGRQS